MPYFQESVGYSQMFVKSRLQSVQHTCEHPSVVQFVGRERYWLYVLLNFSWLKF